MRTQDKRRRFRLALRRSAAKVDALAPIEGVCETPVANEADHFCECEHCGQLYDRRDLGEVLYHAESAHEPHRLT